MKRIVFLLTNPPNPRMQKRVQALQDQFDCCLICIKRKGSDVYSYDPSLFSDVVEEELDLPPLSDFLKRLQHAPAAARIQQKALERFQPDCIYVQGIDCLLKASKYASRHGSHIVYEVADMREVFFSSKSIVRSCRNAIVKRAERWALRNVGLVVVTSEKFAQMRYNKLVGEDRVCFIPNAPNLSAFRTYCRKNSDVFTVGFVGVLRYLDQMKMLVAAAQSIGEINVEFWGEAASQQESDDIRSYCASNENVTFFGRYNYKEQIASIYSRLDCVYSVYDSANPNVQIALPNKLYESVYCGLPMIVARGTYLAEIVDRYGIGVSIDSCSEQELRQALLEMKERSTRYQEMVHNCEKAKRTLVSDDALQSLPMRISKLLD